MKMNLFAIVLVMALCISNLEVVAHQPSGKPIAHRQAKALDFIENKGQWHRDVRFKVDAPGAAVFLSATGFVYSYSHPEDLINFYGDEHEADFKAVPNAKIRQHAYRVNFVGSNSHALVEGHERRSYYHNYFVGNDSSTWRGKVGVFGRVVQKGLYDGIDLVVYSKESSLKYDFIVAKGKSPLQILLAFEGVKPTLTKDGHLKIITSVNEIIEQAPYAYQILGGKEVAVKCSYELIDNNLKFVLPNGYDTSLPLIIDPTVVFATYSGSTGYDKFAYCTTFDSQGNLYSAGHDANIFSSIAGGWPITLGAFQSAPLGDRPIVISKYNSNGTSLVYSTYFGPARWPHALSVSYTGDLYMLGANVDGGMPVTPGCYDNSYNGEVDLFVAHFSSSGSSLLGSTFIGGTDREGFFAEESNAANRGEIIVGSLGEIWVASNTRSSDFPITATAYQSTYSGKHDGVLFKLSSDCSQLLYSSYLGGGGDDFPHGMVFNHTGNLVICGETESYNFPVTAGAIRGALGGDLDGFVSIVNPNTGVITKSSYLGTSSRDAACFLDVDFEDNIYILGTTQGNYPISAGVYSIPSGDLFIDKIKYDLSASLKSTRFGNLQTTLSQFCPSGFILDACENVYITGLNASVTLPVTSGALQSSHRLFWLGVIDYEFSALLYGSFFGATGEHDELHRHYGSQRFNKGGTIYQSFCTKSSNFPTTPGSFSPSKQNFIGKQDIVSAKIDVSEFVPIDTISTISYVKGCFGRSRYLGPSDTTGFGYLWNAGVRSRELSVSQPGLYVVTYKNKNDLCKIYVDSVVLEQIPFPEVVTDLETCPNSYNGTVAASFEQNNSTIYSYILTIVGGDTICNIQSDTGLSTLFLKPGDYALYIRPFNGCDSTIYFAVDALPAPEARFVADSILCVDEAFGLLNTSTGDFTDWVWTFGDGGTSTTFSPTYRYGKAGSYTIRLIMNGEYCSDTSSKVLEVREFSIELIASSGNAGRGDLVSLNSEASGTYSVNGWKPQWMFPDQTAYSQSFKADSSRDYIIIGKSEDGCIDSASTRIVVNPIVFMPSVFSPNGDGRNDYFRPVGTKGDLFKVLYFRVYDRWGKMVWGAYGPDALKGWDGTYSGTQGEVGTYFYTIEIELSSGKNIAQKGDVTLLR